MGDTFDPLDLDWSRHAVDRDGREYCQGGIFLAEAAARMGKEMIEYWQGTEGALLADAVRFPLVRIPPAHQAFTIDGAPIRSVHDAYGPLVRRVMSPALFADLELRASDPDRWIATHVPDPVDGEPIPANVLRARERKDASDSISRENWDCAYVDGVVEKGLRDFAVGKMRAVARALAELSQAGSITMLSRPIREGRTQQLDHPVWSSGAEQRLRRLASCGYSQLDPDDASAEPDHLLFVADAGFEQAIAQYAAANPVTVDELAHSVWPDVDEQPAVQRPKPDARTIMRYIVHLLSSKDRSNWRTKDLDTVILATFGNEATDLTLEVRERVIANYPQFDYLTKGGQPLKRERPSIYGWHIEHPYGTDQFDLLLQRLSES